MDKREDADKRKVSEESQDVRKISRSKRGKCVRGGIILLSRTNGAKKEVMEKIEKWLVEEGYQYEAVNQAYADFQVDLKNPNLCIILHKNKPDCIVFGTHNGFTDDDKKAFSTFKDKEKKLEMLWELQRSLITINVQFSLLPNLDNLERVELQKKVYFDGLTKDKFMDAIFALNRALYAMGLMYQQLRGRFYSNSSSSNLTV